MSAHHDLVELDGIYGLRYSLPHSQFLDSTIRRAPFPMESVPVLSARTIV
jgi:hypothetical protein